MKTIELSHVTTTLGSGPRATTALRDCSLTAGAGEFVALTGKSGSGKTTLLRTIAGLLRPDAGTVEVAGVRVEVAGEKEILKLRRETVGIVHQEDLLLDELTAAENLLLVLTAAGSDAATARAEALRCLEQVGVADLADRLPPTKCPAGSANAWASPVPLAVTATSSSRTSHRPPWTAKTPGRSSGYSPI